MTRPTLAPSLDKPDPSTNQTALGALRSWTSLCIQSLKPKAVGVLCSEHYVCPSLAGLDACQMSHDTTSKFAFILTFVDLK